MKQILDFLFSICHNNDDDGFAVQPLLEDKYEYLLRNTKDEILKEYIKTNAPFKKN